MFKYFDSMNNRQQNNNGNLSSSVEQTYKLSDIPQTLAKKYKIIDYYRKQLKLKK